MAVETKNHFAHLTDEQIGDAYDAWAILALKLDDLPKDAREYFERLLVKIDEFDPYGDEEIALTNHLEIPVIRSRNKTPVGAKSKHDFAHIFDWLDGWQKTEGVSLAKAVSDYVELHGLDAEEFDMVKRAYYAVRRARLSSRDQARPHFTKAKSKPEKSSAAKSQDPSFDPAS